MSRPMLADIKVRLTLQSKDANRHEGTITTYPVVINHLLRRYKIHAVITRARKDISNFEQGLLTPWDLSQR